MISRLALCMTCNDVMISSVDGRAGRTGAVRKPPPLTYPSASFMNRLIAPTARLFSSGRYLALPSPLPGIGCLPHWRQGDRPIDVIIFRRKEFTEDV